MTTTVTPGSRTWTVDSVHSNVGFSARHMMITRVRGKFTGVKGELQVPEGSTIPQSIAADIDAASIDSGEEQRDGHLRSADFFDAQNYPQLTFKSTAIRTVSENAFEVTGDLTIHGTTKSVAFPVDVEGAGPDPWGGRRIGYSAKLRIDRRDFGLTFNQALETGGLMVSNEVDIELDIQAVASAAA